MDKINSHLDNDAQLLAPTGASSYTRNLKIHQMEKDSTDGGRILRTYDLWYAFTAFLQLMLHMTATIRLKNSPLSSSILTGL